ncbi:aspartic proteinase CDR1-like [Salvia hispanica]|uniref:aspartic proteinase CDR1-like n=1 Tax=Salvia hispanica TaxID=49212 RepID=UPI002008F4B8|nr:aspartic proteinase CDR1-like [Salvia hispanica]
MTIVSIILWQCKCNPLLANGSSLSGFTTDLIHTDSPLLNPSLTLEQRADNARNRTLARARRYARGTPEGSLLYDKGAYMMHLFVGTPWKQAMLYVDTGSPLIWTQCSPCKKCTPQRYPLFEPLASETYRLTRCGSIGCRAFGSSGYCDQKRQKCLYLSQYSDGSRTGGSVGTDTFTFHTGERGLVSFPKIVFGCGHDNYRIGSGVAGLGAAPGSLLTQLGYDKFSYCLFPARGGKYETSTLHFGSNAEVSGWGVAATPLAVKGLFYYLTLEAISVADKRFYYHSPKAGAGGPNIVIDNASVLTVLPVRFYDEVEVAIANSIPQRAVRDFREWRLCYSEKFEMPKITVHFKGADVEWRRENVFWRASADYECLALEKIQL